MNLKIKNNYISHLDSLSTDNERQRFVTKINSDADKDNEMALIARCILRLEGQIFERNITDSLKTLDALVKDKRSYAAAYVLGLIYKNGYFEQKENSYKADDYFRLGATKGDPMSAYELGKMYLEGQGVRKDLHEAVRWIDIASSKEQVEAMVIYGKAILEGGTGAFGDAVKSEPSKAIKILTRACDKGNEEAKEVLSKHYVLMALTIASGVKKPTSDLIAIQDALSEVEWVVK